MSSETHRPRRETLHRDLLRRLPKLRQHVQQKIPERLSGMISADDVLQEVWVSAYRSLERFIPRGANAVYSWLATIADSKVVDAIRAARRLKRGGGRGQIRDAGHRFHSFVELFARISSPERTPSSVFQASEMGHAVAMALNQLASDHRRAVYMHHIDGLSLKETARLMGKTEAAVNALIYQGLRELRSLLGDAAKYFSDARSSAGDQPAKAVNR